MSDILQNALRYNATNTQRVDIPGKNSGQLVVGKTGVLGFDCSGYFTHVLRESGFNVSRLTVSGFQQSPLVSNVATADVQAGDAVFFNGHVGFVVSFNSIEKTGIFRSMTGGGIKGELKDAPFSTNNMQPTKEVGYWGTTDKKWLSFGRVSSTAYDQNLDAHLNGNTNPVLHSLINPARGVASTGIPNSSNTIRNYVEVVGDSQTGKLYDNGVLYTKDVQTGKEFWSVPTSTGGAIETTRFPGGEVTTVLYNLNATSGNYMLDNTTTNVQQYIKQQTLSLPASDLGAQDQQLWQAGYKTVSDAIANDPASVVDVSSGGAAVVRAGGNVYAVVGQTVLKYYVGVSGQPNGKMDFLTGTNAGKTISFSSDGNAMLTATQVAGISKNMVSNLVSTGAPIDYAGNLSPDVSLIKSAAMADANISTKYIHQDCCQGFTTCMSNIRPDCGVRVAV